MGNSGTDPWYRRASVLDLTGDGQADSVEVRAVGTRTDSLEVTLSIFVAGENKLQESWGSGYELDLVDSLPDAGPARDSFLRAQLDSVLASVALESLGPTGMELFEEDSAALAGITPKPRFGVSFSYGYETTVRLAWDDARKRFVRLWSCC